MNSSKKRKMNHTPATFPMATLGNQFAMLALKQQKQQVELREVKTQLSLISGQLAEMSAILEKLVRVVERSSPESEPPIPPEYNYYA